MAQSDVLARRLRKVRLQLFGAHGAPLLAEALEIPVRTWVNYECGIVIPGLVLLRLITDFGVEPQWLLTGAGRMFRSKSWRSGDQDQWGENDG
jgi:hypothetical protein